jgi:hypothetical protein
MVGGQHFKTMRLYYWSSDPVEWKEQVNVQTPKRCTCCGRKYKRSHACRGRSHRELRIALPENDDTTDITSDQASVQIKIADSHQRITQQFNKLTAHELLLYNIKTYFRNTCRNMKFDGRGTLITPNGAKLRNDCCTEFDSYYFTATILSRKKKYHDCYIAISKASQLVEQIVRAEHPRTLACFFEVFIHLTQNGFDQVTLLLRDNISAVAIPIFQEGHPWGQILRLFCKIDPDLFRPTIERAWECITDTCDRELSSTSPLAVSIRLDYVKRVCGSTNPMREETLLRELLGTLEKPGSHRLARLAIPRVMLNLARSIGRHKDNLEVEALALRASQMLKDEIYAEKDAERIECLKILSHNQFKRGCIVDAEKNMRAAIKMIEEKMGKHHSWAYEFMNVLENWFRSWGRVTEANALWADIQEEFGNDKDNNVN